MKSVIVPSVQSPPSMLKLHDFCNRAHTSIEHSRDWCRSLLILNCRHCCKVSDEAAFCLIQRPYISKTLLTRRISPRGSP
ncbi:hypothetical protein B6V59_25660 [Escherichia coli]|nr:hypothetical protein [Escherichia coli]MBW1552601.1 hypothetical protein [Escherichia coli]